MSVSPPPVIEVDSIRWIEVKRAASFASTKAIEIEAAIRAGSMASIEIDGQTFIHLAAAHRLKREAATMREIKRKSKLGDTLPTGSRQGPLSAHREKQLPLPMTSGRKGRGRQS